MNNIKFDPQTKDRTTRLCKCGCSKMIATKNRNGELFYVPGHQWRGKKRIGENRDQRGTKNNNYRGGRTKDHKGYIHVRCVGHPRASKKGSYVREHILIMEKHLGRYLREDERVHHINGINDDNRIVNLKLMTDGTHSSYHRKKEVENGKKLFGK